MEERHVVYRVPGMDQVVARCDLPYKPEHAAELLMDVYQPPGLAVNERRPAVVFVHGEVRPETVPHVKNWASYRDWGRLVAASGLVGVTFNHRSTERYTRFDGAVSDIDDLIAHIRDNAPAFNIDADHLAIWTCSAGAYLGLRAALRGAPAYVRGVVSYYGIMDIAHFLSRDAPDAAAAMPDHVSPLHYLRQEGEPVPPMFIVRAGRDRPAFNESIDQFLTEALAHNMDIALVNYPEGRHGFDTVDDTERSREIIQQTLVFLQKRLLDRSPVPALP